jgi:hypothetical protein
VTKTPVVSWGNFHTTHVQSKSDKEAAANKLKIQDLVDSQVFLEK